MTKFFFVDVYWLNGFLIDSILDFDGVLLPFFIDVYLVYWLYAKVGPISFTVFFLQMCTDSIVKCDKVLFCGCVLTQCFLIGSIINCDIILLPFLVDVNRYYVQKVSSLKNNYIQTCWEFKLILLGLLILTQTPILIFTRLTIIDLVTSGGLWDTLFIASVSTLKLVGRTCWN